MNTNLRFLNANSATAALMRSADWSGSPLGPPDTWPQPLRSATGLMLASKFPMFVAWGPSLGFLYNDAYIQVLGTKHPQALGRPLQEVWSEVWNDISPLIERALAGEATFHENLPFMLRREGYDEQTWFTFSYSPVFDEHGDVAGMYCICTETTAAVLASRHRERENERLRLLFRQAPGLIAVARGPDHVFELANDAYIALVGERELIGRPAREALPEVEGQGLFELLDNVYRTGEPYIGRGVPVRLRRQPGKDAALEERYVDFIYQPIRDDDGQVTGIFVEGSDVTEAVEALNAVREREERLRQLANTIHHLAWIAGPDGEVEWYNDRWFEYTGTTLEQMRGSGWVDVVAPDDLPRLLERWNESITTGKPYEITVPLRGVDGQFRRFFIRAAPVRDASGAIVHWFGTNTDVTEAYEAQEDLRRADRRKDEFLAMLAHELRNPLAPINTAARLLTMVGDDPARVRQASDIITRQVEHMVSLVDDLLDVSRVTRGLIELQKEHLDIKAIVAHAVEQARPLIESRGHRLVTAIAAERLHVEGDRTRLTQVITNLLNNAAKYTPQGGTITLGVESYQGTVAVQVQDNGIGIDAALLPHVFELFTQAERTPDRSQGGLGIGLALARSIVGLHGGTLQAASEGPGRGAAFTVELPLAQDASAAVEAVSEPSDAPWAPASVMVVDDNADAAQSLAILLGALGHPVTVKHDGLGALQAAQGEAFDVFVLDIGLPDIDGYELARRLRAESRSPDALMIALTGYGQPQDRVLSRTAGFDHHLVKPADMRQLLALIARALRPAMPA